MLDDTRWDCPTVSYTHVFATPIVMPATPDYTAKLDTKRRLLLRGGDALYDLYQVRHRDDGVIELRPQVTVDVASVSARTLATIEQSMEALERGEASAPVDLSETFPGLDDEVGGDGAAG